MRCPATCNRIPCRPTSQRHTFAVDSHAVCLNCHAIDPGSSGPGVSNQVTTVLVLLNTWAATQGAALQTNGVVAWEYTTPGGLVLQTNSLGYATGWIQLDQVNYSGPNAAGQLSIPDNIKKARFNLYLVVNDGSLGVHNWIFALNLLSCGAKHDQPAIIPMNGGPQPRRVFRIYMP